VNSKTQKNKKCKNNQKEIFWLVANPVWREPEINFDRVDAMF
jgi:hypothetical protein